MRNYVKKAVAACATVAIIMPLAAACNKSGGSSSAISPDTPWYNVKSSEIGKVEGDNVDFSQSSYICTYDDRYVYKTTIMYKAPEGFDYDKDDLNTLYGDYLEVYNIDGELESSIDIGSETKELDIDDFIMISDIVKLGDSVIVYLQSADQSTGVVHTYQSTIDIHTGKLGEIVRIDDPVVKQLEDEGAFLDNTIIVCGKLINCYFLSEDMSYCLVINDENGNSSSIDLREVIPGESLWNIESIIAKDDSHALICASSNDGGVFLDLDLMSMTASRPSQDMTWLSDEVRNISYVEDTGSVISNGNGVYKINFDTQSFEEIFLFDNTNINRYEITYLKPISVTDEKVVMTGTSRRFNEAMEYVDCSLLAEFTKADSNPNAGKNIINVAVLSDYNYALCDTVCKFNETNDDYFIRLDPRYMASDPTERGYAVVPSEEEEREKLASSLGNQLAIDLMSGNGPDIIIDGFKFDQINNENYLLPMNDYINSDLTSDKFFANIITEGDTSATVYQLPITFGIVGISANTADIEDGKDGFTYDEYSAFVSTTCNGSDPMGLSKTDFFIESFNGMSDLMRDENGNINLDNEAFRTLAEYTRDNIIDPTGDTNNGEEYKSIDVARSAEIVNANGFINRVCEGKTLVGIPTYDGRGPVVNVRTSVAVSSQTANAEGCMVFVNELMSAPVQQSYGTSGTGLPVNREAFKAISEAYVDYHNNTIKLLLEDCSEAELASYGINSKLADYSVVDDLSTLIDGLSGIRSKGDNSINAILKEELPSYFEGQKSLDEVITIANDRIQTIITERK